MFGEENIYGQTSVSLDSKSRIILPKFTYIEPKEELLIVDKEQYLSVCKEDKMNNIIKQLEEQYICGDSKRKREIDLELLKISSSILKKVQSDKQHRINLSGIEIKDKKVLCIGAKDSLILDVKQK